MCICQPMVNQIGHTDQLKDIEDKFRTIEPWPKLSSSKVSEIPYKKRPSSLTSSKNVMGNVLKCQFKERIILKQTTALEIGEGCIVIYNKRGKSWAFRILRKTVITEVLVRKKVRRKSNSRISSPILDKNKIQFKMLNHTITRLLYMMNSTERCSKNLFIFRIYKFLHRYCITLELYFKDCTYFQLKSHRRSIEKLLKMFKNMSEFRQTSSKILISDYSSYSVDSSSKKYYSSDNSYRELPKNKGKSKSKISHQHTHIGDASSTNVMKSTKLYFDKSKFNFDFYTRPFPKHKKKFNPVQNETNDSSRKVAKMIDKILKDPKKFDKRNIDSFMKKKFKQEKSKTCSGSEMLQHFAGVKINERHNFQFPNELLENNASSKIRRCSCCFSCNWRRNFNGYFVKLPDTMGLGRRAKSLESLSTLSNTYCCLSNAEKENCKLSDIQHDISPDNTHELTETRGLLKRLDSVLSDLVEREKRKIKLYHSNKKLLCSKTGAIFKENTKSRILPVNDSSSYRGPPEPNVPYSNNYPSPADVMKKHSKWFIDLKPYIFPAEKKDHKIKHCSSEFNKQYTKRTTKKEDHKCSNEDSTLESFSQRSRFPFTNTATSLSDVLKGSSVHDSFELSEKVSPHFVLADETSGTGEILKTSVKQSLNPKALKGITEVDSADFSVDSAYVGSRQTTPDSAKILGKASLPDYTVNKKKFYKPKENNGNEINTEIEKGRQYILGKIKDTQSYSDREILLIMSDFKEKWKHLSEKEISTVVGTVKRDLGLLPTPLECASIILYNDLTKCNQAETQNKELISSTLPSVKDCMEHLAKSTSMSGIVKKSSTHNNVFRRPSSSMALNPRDIATSAICTDVPIEKCHANIVTPPTYENVDQECYYINCLPVSIAFCKSTDSCKNETQESSDLLWAKGTLGEETCTRLLNVDEIDIHHSKTVNYDWKKLSSEICTQFGISLGSP